MVPAAVRPGPVLDRDDRAGRHQRLRGVVSRAQHRVPDHRRGVRGCPAGPYWRCEPPPNGRMVRLTIEVVEENVARAVGEEDEASVREAVVRYAREVAFATAEVYARAAEMRGAWDARLEALVVDSVLRAEADETTRSRASALGWESKGDVVVVLGRVPAADAAGQARESLFDDVRRSARHAGLDALCAVQSDRLVVVLGGVDNPDKAGAAVAQHFGEGPVVVGPLVPDLVHANVSARAARCRPAGRAGVARGASPGDQRRPVARARALRRRARAAAARAGRVRPAARGRRPHPGHRVGVPRPRRLDRGHGARHVRAREHRALPAAARLGDHRAVGERPAPGLHLPGRADPRPAGRSRGTRHASL